MDDAAFTRRLQQAHARIDHEITLCPDDERGDIRKAALIEAKAIYREAFAKLNARPPLKNLLEATVRENPWIDPAEAAAITKRHPNTVRRELALMWCDGKLQRTRVPAIRGNSLHFRYALPGVEPLGVGVSEEPEQDRQREEAP